MGGGGGQKGVVCLCVCVLCVRVGRVCVGEYVCVVFVIEMVMFCVFAKGFYLYRRKRRRLQSKAGKHQKFR
eukprot:m.104858 g.104858  ORF g.104858 m.104858 type:complete len:71 (+) comp22464_c0_seq3:1290-1502(+)